MERPAKPARDRRKDPKLTWSTPRIEELDVSKDTAGSPGFGSDFNGRS